MIFIFSMSIAVKGCGTDKMRVLEAEAKNQKNDKISLHVFSHNKRAYCIL